MNPQSNLIICQTDTAALVARAVAQRGCTIESIALGGARPVIWIQADRAAAKLFPSAVYMIETIRGKRYETKVAEFKGCQVRWRVERTPDPDGLRAFGVERSGTGVAA